ncbi:eukaryotic translation initiation factor 3 subunit A-like [Ornithodoros turicata]|uniref:Eukaryotic translation initiation factor 3 subunit A n=1 Tax=Ornithodoros turicata TaxID=34597 RepID=A0A2R5LH62_9ACAR
MPTYFQRPENALKRAREFIDVGKKHRALDALYDVIKSRKHRTWQKVHEPIMQQYLELCVELKKSHVAKEGLFQYRNICQQVNIKSLEDVVRGYLDLAEEKTEAAREESQQAVVDIDDLDNVQTPESLLLSAVSSEDTQDRTDRVVLTPWVKFLWESYRQCLELLRNNSRVERLYHDIAQQAFKFCLKYNRKTEFRKLCDHLRTHLGHIHRHQSQQTAVNLNNPDSQAMHLETRLVQLDSAIQMELWQEAYKATEDIHGLMTLSKKSPKPQLMANYYQKLALVFWKAGNHLFHASALFRYFHLAKDLKKNITSEEIQKMASRVVLATLAVPMPPNRPEIDRLVETDENVIDKNQRLLATLLGLTGPPTRASLVKDLVRLGVVGLAPTQLQDLYRWLEVDFHPLKLCGRVTQCFDFINKWEECSELRVYVSALQDITVMRLLKEVSQVYETIEFSRLLELAPFATAFYLENMVVEAVRRNDLQVRIDHSRHCLHFGSELSVSQREEVIEGPHLQGMPSEQIRCQLVKLYSVLQRSVHLIRPEQIKESTKELKMHIIDAYRLVFKKEHKKILERQQIIEARKELLETLTIQREEEERKQIEERQQKLREAEEERIVREAEERAKQRSQREQDEMKKKVVLEKIELLRKTDIGARIFEGLEEKELERLDPEEILNRQVEQLDRERKEMQMKLKKQERKVDYMERAKRIEEIPLLQEAYEKFKVEDEKFWQQKEEERIKLLIQERELALQHKKRMLRMKEDKENFLNKLTADRYSVYKEKRRVFEKHLEEERTQRLAERKAARKESRREKYVTEKEEAERNQLLEEQRRAEQERLAKLKDMEAIKLAREREIEEKQRRMEEEEKMNVEGERKREIRTEEMNWRKRDSEPERKNEPWRPTRARDNRDADRDGPRRGRDDDKEPPKERPWGRDRDTEKESRIEEDNWRQHKADDVRPSPRAPESRWRKDREDGEREERHDSERGSWRSAGARRGGDRGGERGGDRGGGGMWRRDDRDREFDGKGRDFDRGPPRGRDIGDERGPRGGRDMGSKWGSRDAPRGGGAAPGGTSWRKDDSRPPPRKDDCFSVSWRDKEDRSSKPQDEADEEGWKTAR